MLDDSDEEGAGQAQPGPRRTTRSNAYKGPADTLKVPPQIQTTHNTFLQGSSSR